MPPACPGCKRFMRPQRNDVAVEVVTHRNGALGIYQLWAADLWACPQCQTKILAGFGHRPSSQSSDSDYEKWVKAAEVRGGFFQVEA